MAAVQHSAAQPKGQPTGESFPADDAAAYLASIVESSSDAIIGLTLGGLITSWNPAAERIFGHPAQEVLGRPITLLIPAELHGEEQALLLRVRAGELVTAYETVRVRKSGERLNISLTISPVRAGNGRIVAATAIARDVTELKRASEAAAQLRLAIEAAPNGMVMIDESGRITMVNSQLERLFGYERAELMGQPIEMLLPERYRAAHPGQRAAFFHSPVVRAMGHGRDLFARRKDGTEFPVEVGLNPAETPEGTFVLAAIIDITERKRIENDLAKSAMQFRLVVEGAPNGMVMVNESGRILMVNSQMERLFGYDRAEMIGQPIEMLLPERYRGKHPSQRGEFFHSPLTRAMGHGRDLFARRKDGTEFPVEVGLNPAETPEGTVVLAAVIDITQRKRMEAELAKVHTDLREHAHRLEATVQERTAHLRQTIAELESVSYSLSHDLRGPLRTIQGFAQLVLDDAGERLNSEERDLLGKAIKAAHRLDRLIQDVLTYSKVSRQTVTLESVDVEKLIRQIIDERPELRSPRAELEIVSPLLPVMGHEASLTQVITNLLDNAVKFMPPDRSPRIRISSRPAGGQVELWFEDNGIGIPREAQPRLFAIFQRVHDEKRYPGTGIGLAIVRKAVERMGGTVHLESELGVGTRFCVRLAKGSP